MKERRKFEVDIETAVVARGAVEERFVDHVGDLRCKMGSRQSKVNPPTTAKIRFKRGVERIPVFPYINKSENVTKFL